MFIATLFIHPNWKQPRYPPKGGQLKQGPSLQADLHRYLTKEAAGRGHFEQTWGVSYRLRDESP